MGKGKPRLNTAPKVTQRGSRTGNETLICSFPSPRLSHLVSQLVSQPALFWAGSPARTEGAYGTSTAQTAAPQRAPKGLSSLPRSEWGIKTCPPFTQPWLCLCAIRRAVLTLVLLEKKISSTSFGWGGWGGEEVQKSQVNRVLQATRGTQLAWLGSLFPK